MNVDFIQVIGKSHSVCQDFAGGRVSNTWRQETLEHDAAVAVISDGCSSVRNSHLDSSCLVNSVHSLGYLTYYDVLGISETYNLMATLVMVEVDESAITFRVKGDGVFGYMLKSGEIEIYSIEFSDNAPDYVGYLFQENSSYNIEQLAKQTVTVKSLVNPEKTLEYKINESVYGLALQLNRDEFDVDYVFVCSDGILTPEAIKTASNEVLTKFTPEQLNETIIRALTLSKNRNGEFVKRRVLSGFDRFFPNGFSDDISISMISL